MINLNYPGPAFEAELAYRRERLMAAGRGTRTRPFGWFRNRRRAR